MTGTILSYLKEYADVSLLEKPLNDVDCLILCQLSYLKFDGFVPEINVTDPGVELCKIAARSDLDKLFADERFEKVNREFFKLMVGSVRFSQMKLTAYVNLIEKEYETQFSAVTFRLDDGTAFVAFRGTDETLVGWKEDFNMAFQCPVPSQKYSVKYLNMIGDRFEQPLYVGGHSKGGNLAVYSAMNCREDVRSRIRKIFSMDGPGFQAEILKSCGFEKIEDRVVKILPHSGLIGMLFEKNISYRVVESKNLGILQHDPFSWIVREDHFVEANDLYERSKFIDSTINEWVLSLDKEKREKFVDALFRIFEGARVDNLIELGEDKKKSFLGMVNAMKELDEETAAELTETIRLLFEIAGNRVIRELNQRLEKLKENVQSKGEAVKDAAATRKKEKAQKPGT